MRNVLFEISHRACPAGLVMDFPVARKANSDAVLEIIQSLSISSREMVDLGGDRGADLTLDMFPQER
jgi:hypothetical protein